MKRVYLPLVACLSFVAACSNHQSTPTSPAPATAGAIINGSILTTQADAASVMAAGPAAVHLTVSIAGTNLSVAVDGSNAFVLQHVPAGDVELRFTGSGVDGRVPLAAVSTDDTIDLIVRLTGSTISVESEHRNQGPNPGPPSTPAPGPGPAPPSPPAPAPPAPAPVPAPVPPPEDNDVQGVVASMTGTPPVLTLVGGGVVRTDASTVVRRGDVVVNFTAIAVGATIEVEGVRQADGSILARKIQIEDEDEREVELEGAISNLQGGCPAIQFVVNGTMIISSSATDFRTSCAVLANGADVEVKGMRLADGRVSATRIERKR